MHIPGDPKGSAQVPVFHITNTGDKVLRIVGIQPMVKSGAIRFSRRHRTLLEQLRQFPKGTHDDGPDALQINICRNDRPPLPRTEGASWRGPGEPHPSDPGILFVGIRSWTPTPHLMHHE